MSFAEVLAGLPAVEHLSGIELTGPDGENVLLENQPGSQGSLKVYHYLLQKYGSINREAANAGLILYSEHTFDARANPGKHPNIDRLLAIAADGRPWQGRVQSA
jgi:hypothetical protein